MLVTQEHLCMINTVRFSEKERTTEGLSSKIPKRSRSSPGSCTMNGILPSDKNLLKDDKLSVLMVYHLFSPKTLPILGANT